MRSPHAKITILALCGLAAAAGMGAAASPAVTGSQGPVAAYGFDEGAGARVADASDNANNGTTTAPRTQAGRFGRALRMDRPSEAAIIPDSASLRPATAVTLEAWVRPDRADGSRAIVVKEGGNRVAYALTTTGGRPQAVDQLRLHHARRPRRLAAEGRTLDPPDRDLRRPHGAPARGRRRGRTHPGHRQAPHGPAGRCGSAPAARAATASWAASTRSGSTEGP